MRAYSARSGKAEANRNTAIFTELREVKCLVNGTYKKVVGSG